MTTTAPTTREAIERYLRFWNIEGEDQRRLAGRAFTEDVEYHAFPGTYAGIDALIDFKRQFVEGVGVVTMTARKEPDHHHDRARLPWELLDADGVSFATGTDMLHLSPDGRIASITVFLDRAPKGFEHPGGIR